MPEIKRQFVVRKTVLEGSCGTSTCETPLPQIRAHEVSCNTKTVWKDPLHTRTSASLWGYASDLPPLSLLLHEKSILKDRELPPQPLTGCGDEFCLSSMLSKLPFFWVRKDSNDHTNIIHFFFVKIVSPPRSTQSPQCRHSIPPATGQVQDYSG